MPSSKTKGSSTVMAVQQEVSARAFLAMKQFQKRFIKQVVADATVLSALIILPLAFLGPGWRAKNPDDRVQAARFRDDHAPTASTERNEPS